MIIGEFADCYPPEIDGVGRVVKSYAEELSRLGDECYYIAPEAPENGGEKAYKTLLFKGIKMPNEPYHVGIPIFDLPFILRENRIRFDILHAHSPFFAGQDALRLANARHIPVVATFHSKYYDDFYSKTHSRPLSEIGTKMIVDFYNRCDEVWTVNEKTAEVLREYGYRREIVVMPNGTDLYTPDPASISETRRLYDLNDTPVLLYAGQMNWKKNIRRILEGAALYAREHDFRLVLAGQGPDVHEIAACVSEFGLENHVVFTGHIAERERMMSLFACADMFIFPSQYDTSGLVVREAAAMGTPSLLLRGSCASEGVVDGVNGFLCDDTPKSVAECIEKGLPRAEEVGAKAKQTIPIAWSGIVQKARERYIELIERKKTEE